MSMRWDQVFLIDIFPINLWINIIIPSSDSENSLELSLDDLNIAEDIPDTSPPKEGALDTEDEVTLLQKPILEVLSNLLVIQEMSQNHLHMSSIQIQLMMFHHNIKKLIKDALNNVIRQLN